jgi:hypothetical protein
MIYGLTVQKLGHLFEFRCSDCSEPRVYRHPLIRETKPLLTIFCKVHTNNFGEWRSEQEMEQEKLYLAKRIGLSD